MATLPLDGIRVIDLAVVWAGPFATMLLGDLGAEVIKVENPHVMQPMTRGPRHAPPQAVLERGPAATSGYPDQKPGERPYNYYPTFVQMFRNKKSFTVDMRTPEGRDILRRLIAVSDVVVENNATETMESLGVTYEWLRSIRPDIIMVRMPAYGSNGPYDNARALGVHLESVMGHTALRGYRDLDPSMNSAIFSGDYVGGAQAALAVMFALWHRQRTGEGQLIELAQAENASGMLFQAFMDYALNGRLHEPLGNRSIYGAAPCGVFPCLSPGGVETADDRWISITVTNDEEWQALKRVMGSPAWADDPALDTFEGRRERQDLLEARLAEWTAGLDDYDLFHRLQAAGVPAAPVLESSRAYDDAHVVARELVQPQRLKDLDREYRFTTPFYRFPETPATVRQPPVALGEHNDYVYRQVLGLGEEEYEALRALGHISEDFDESLP